MFAKVEAAGRDGMIAESGGSWTWEEMIAEFRALGGVADNVRMGVGRRGRGLFAIDPARDVRVRAPRGLLIDVDELRLDNGRLELRDGAVGQRERAFFERFEAAFSFGAGAAEEGRLLLAELYALPESVQEHLLGSEPPGQRRFSRPSDALLLDWFKDTRSAAEKSADGPEVRRRFVMPVVELVNHSSRHPFFVPGEAGIEIAGRFADEVLFRYNIKDTWQKFTQWGFVSIEPLAFSIALAVSAPGGQHVRVGRKINDFENVNGVPAPKVERAGDVVKLSHLMLGSRTMPGLPRWLFRRCVKAWAPEDPDELFDVIAHANRQWFLKLLELLEDHQGAMITRLRQAARLQLENLSFSIGAREEMPPGDLRHLIDSNTGPPSG